MSIALQNGHWYQLNNGDVGQCEGGDNAKLNDVYYSDVGYPRDHNVNHLIVNEVHPDTLQNLDVKAGDVVRCVRWRGTSHKAGEVITWGRDDIAYDAGLWIIISRAKDNPKTWGELTRIEQGDILVDDQNGLEIEAFVHGDFWEEKRNGFPYLAHKSYRTKPTPVVDTVTVNVKPNKRGDWVSDISCAGSHEITFQTKDGVPQWDTLTGGDV